MKCSKPNPYPPDWGEIAGQIKAEAGHCCVRCGHPNDRESGHVLTVHHLDMDPSNVKWWNLPPLCQKCHLSVQGRVILDRGWLLEHSNWFKPYVAGYYSSCMGTRDDKEWVMAHLEDILERGRTA